MDMRGIVPTGRERRRVAVEGDAAADEHEPVDVLLDGSELVRAKEDRHAEVPVELLEEGGERLLGVHVDAGGRLVQDEQVRARGKRLGKERTLLLSSREPAQDRPGLVREADPLDCLVDEQAIFASEWAEHTARHATALDDFTNRDGCIDAELSALRKVSDPSSSRELDRRLAEQQRVASRRVLEPDGNAEERRLATAIRAGDGDELSGLYLEVDVVQDLGPTRVGEAHVTELDG
jgi:hypothetical protein